MRIKLEESNVKHLCMSNKERNLLRCENNIRVKLEECKVNSRFLFWWCIIGYYWNSKFSGNSKVRVGACLIKEESFRKARWCKTSRSLKVKVPACL